MKAALRKVINTKDDNLPDLTDLTPPYDIRQLQDHTPANKAQAKFFAAVAEHLSDDEPERAIKEALTE